MSKSEVKFVDWPTYIKRFSESVEGILPLGSEKPYEELMNAADNCHQMISQGISRTESSTEAYCKSQKDYDAKYAALVNYIKEGLRQEYGDMKFCYSEIEDNSSSTAAEEFDCWSDESLAQERFMYVDQLKPLKFHRIFNNH